MDKSILYSIIGILFTIIFGLLGMYYVKKYKYPGRISFIKILSIGLLNDLIQSFKEITIKYNDIPITENLHLLKAIIYNDGKTDIDENMVKKSLNILLPKDFKWIDIKIDSYSPNIDCTYKLENNNRSLEWNLGLFRIGEFISFEALIEAPNHFKNSENLINEISFNSRISNCIVKKRSFPNDRSFQGLAYMFGILFLLPIIIVIISLWNPFRFQNHQINFQDKQGNVYKIFEYNREYITIEELKTNHKNKIKVCEFESGNDFKPVIPKKVDLKTFIPIVSIFLLFAIIGFFIVNRERKQYLLYTKGLKQKNYFTDLTENS